MRGARYKRIEETRHSLTPLHRLVLRLQESIFLLPFLFTASLLDAQAPNPAVLAQLCTPAPVRTSAPKAALRPTMRKPVPADRTGIENLKRKSRESPLDAGIWNDIAWLAFSLGDDETAEAALKKSRWLSPLNPDYLGAQALWRYRQEMPVQDIEALLALNCGGQCNVLERLEAAKLWGRRGAKEKKEMEFPEENLALNIPSEPRPQSPKPVSPSKRIPLERMTRNQLRHWQYFLENDGFTPGVADGFLGPGTRSATQLVLAEYGQSAITCGFLSRRLGFSLEELARSAGR